MEKKLLVVVRDCNQLLNFALNNSGAKISANFIRVIVVAELVVTGTYCILFRYSMKA